MNTAVATLIRAAVVDAGGGFEVRVAGRHLIVNDRVGVGADAFDRLASDLHRLAAGILVDVEPPPTRAGTLPFGLGKIELAFGPSQPGRGPINPVRAVAVTAVGGNQVEVLGALEIEIDGDRMTGCRLSDDFALPKRILSDGRLTYFFFFEPESSLM